MDGPGHDGHVSRRPGPPYLELGCFFDGTPYDQALRRFLDRLGARPRSFDAQRGPGLRTLPFTGPIEGGAHETGPGGGLADAFAEPDLRVTRIDVEEGLGVVPGAQEIVAVLGTRRPSLVHPVAVWADGQAFSRPPGEEEAMRDAAARAFKSLRRLVERVEPTYASLTLLSSLPAPDDVARGVPAPYDLYLTERLLELVEARALFAQSGAKVEALHGGVYVSAGSFNPKGRALPVDARDRIGVELGRRLAERLAR